MIIKQESLKTMDRQTELSLQNKLDEICKEFSIFYRVLGLPDDLLYPKRGTVEQLRDTGIELTVELVEMIMRTDIIRYMADDLGRRLRIKYDSKDEDWHFFNFFERYEQLVEKVRVDFRQEVKDALPFVRFVRSLPKYQQLKHELFDKWR